METTRVRFGSILEWLLAAALITAALLVGSIVIGEFRTVRAVMPVIAGEPTMPDPPAGIPPRAVSVPMLLLGDGKEVHVGDRSADVLATVGAAAQIGAEAVDRTGVRERVTRLYEHFGTRFILVLEAFEPDADLRVAGIYLP